MSDFKLGRAAPGIPVTDIERAARFYQDVFGLEKPFENGTPVGCVIPKRDGAELHLTLSPNHKAGLHNVLHLMVSDHNFGLRAFVIADPNGNRSRDPLLRGSGALSLRPQAELSFRDR